MMMVQKLLGDESRFNIQYRTINFILFMVALGGSSFLLITLIRGSYYDSIFLPAIIGTLVSTTLFLYARFGHHPMVCKSLVLFLMDFVYFPFIYFYDGISKDVLPYYTILLLIISFLLIERPYEYAYPVAFVIMTGLFMYLQVMSPSVFLHFTSLNSSLIIYIHVGMIVTLILGLINLLMDNYRNVQVISMNSNVKKDTLTGLLTRRDMIAALKVAMKDKKAHQTNYTLLWIELDALDETNKLLGTLKTDDFIRDFSSILLDNIRHYDLAFRYGGKTMVLLLAHTTPGQLGVYASRIEAGFHQLKTKYETKTPYLLVGMSGFDYNDCNEVVHVAKANLTQLDGGRND